MRDTETNFLPLKHQHTLYSTYTFGHLMRRKREDLGKNYFEREQEKLNLNKQYFENGIALKRICTYFFGGVIQRQN